MSATGRVVALAAAIVVGTACIAPSIAMAATKPNGTAAASSTGLPYGGDPAKEAALVATENQRINNLRAITAASRWRGIDTTNPYRVTLGSTATLVLVARGTPYSISDLESLIPSTFVRQPDGVYVLSDDIVVEAGATLDLSSTDGFQLHLASSSKGFVSIIALGGSLNIAGSSKSPARIDAWDQTLGGLDTTRPEGRAFVRMTAGSSKSPARIDAWDRTLGGLDTNTADGRAYIRVIGGRASISYAALSHLGFWGGGTGGLAFTGTARTARDTAAATTPHAVIPRVPHGNKIHGVPSRPVRPHETIDQVASAIEATRGRYNYVTANLDHVSIVGNAFGVFVSGADTLTITHATIRDSLIDGIVFHRFVTNSSISSTTSDNNAVDGFALTRASTGVMMSGLTANGNGRDGISLNGTGLANGPNASGNPVGSYGNNAVRDSVARGNARDGINVIGGSGIGITGNTVIGNKVGIVVSTAASAVTIRANVIDQSSQHAIAFLGHVTQSTIRENSISGANIGIYLRDSSAIVEQNILSKVTNHGITLIGSAANSTVRSNSVGGSGPGAVDTARATGVIVGNNYQKNWTNTKPISVILAGIFQPLSVLWMLLGMTVVISALASVGKRRTGFRHPYADQVPLASLTQGVVRPEELGLTNPAIRPPLVQQDWTSMYERRTVRVSSNEP